ncbi:GNAT family N-acetyltransferase [Actinokineospora iranica]|uniref:Acetyltransferase (GNAT) family protein n=1 Tax=Actinokineospora iranica TaxID=1271860 RepID=A0A1G6YDN2_9PSEU|nr:GNAT family N-acetyltransferase [Actinokineospora iranica]SDD88478.1 Acetyltransferase (GNAT) family protein [Actinokineospora iranica]
MPEADRLASRIAAAQLAGLSRDRAVIPAGPFTGLLSADGPGYMSYAVATHPGEPVRDADKVARSLEILRAAFPPGGLRFELIEQACPGAADTLAAAGLTVTMRIPLLVLDPADLLLPKPLDGVAIDVVRTTADLAASAEVARAAFGAPPGEPPTSPPPAPENGGSVLATLDGEPVAVASWTPVAHGVTEIAGVGTAENHRRKGLGALVTAHAVRAATDLAGVRLAWLTPGSEDADRVYRTVGFVPTATAVHLADTEP